MNLKNSRLMSIATSLLVIGSSFVALPAAHASSAPVNVTFESNDTSGYSFVDYDGAVTTTTSSAPAGAGFTSGVAMAQDNQGALWSGTTFLTLDSGSSLISSADKTATLSVYSPDSTDRCVDLKLEGTAVAEKTLHVNGAGWQTLTFDFSDSFNDAQKYFKASLMPNIGGAGCAWSADKTETVWYFDNISFPGATKADVVTPRTTPTVLVNFESNDTSGYLAGGAADFGGTISSKVNDAPAGGSADSTSALKLSSAGACWSGATFLTRGLKESLVSAGKTTVTANVYSPIAGGSITLKLESSVTGGANVQKTLTTTAGWQTLSFDLSGYDTAVDFNKASIFPDFNPATAGCADKTPSVWYIDDIAFNGATGAALAAGGSGGNSGGGSPTAFSGNATVRLAGIDATNSVENTGAEQDWSVAHNWYRGGVRALTKQVPVGSTQHLTYVVNNSADGSPLANVQVTFVMGKAYSGSSAKVNVGGVASTGNEVTVTGVTNSQGLVSFDLVNSDIAADAANNPGSVLNVLPTGKDLRTQIAAWVTSPAQDTIDVVDMVYYAPATVAPTPTVVSRVTGIDSTNAAVGSTDGWAQYYGAGLRYFERGVTVGTTTHLSYTVTADGAPYANKTVHLLLGKTYSGSSANVTVNGSNFPGAGDQTSIDLTTDSNGVVSFDVVNNNFSAQADPYQANNVLHPQGGKHLFAQLALVGEKGNQDVLDILDLVYYQAQGAPAPTVYNVRLADWNAGNSFDGTHVWGDGGLGNWFDAYTGYFAHYVKAGATTTLRYSVTNAKTGAAAPNGTVVDLALGAAWSGSNAKFTVNGVSVSGLTKWGANGQLDQTSTTATVSNGYVTLTLVSLDDPMDATQNPGSPKANPDQLNPLFMQIKTNVEGNSLTHQDWINVVVTQPKSSAPTITSVSATSGKKGQAIDIVGTNLNDALGTSVVLYTAATRTAQAVSQNVTVLSVSADGTRATISGPANAQKGVLKVTTSGGTATAATTFSASATVTTKPAITFPASLVKEVGSSFTLNGTNIASSSAITIGGVNASFTILTANSVSVTVPAGVVSGSTISATNAGGTVTSSKVIYQAPVVATATASGKVKSTVTITGSNLKATSVVFGGNKTAKPVINNGSTLTVLVPSGAQTGAIKIVTGGGVVYTASFTVTK